MGPATVSRSAGDGAVTARHTLVYGLALAAGADDAAVNIKDGDSGGTVVLTLKALAGDTVVFTPAVPFVLGTGFYVDFTAGTSPLLTAVYV